MNRDTFRAMIRGLVATIIEKEVVLGEADAKESVLAILDLLEDLDLFWNSDMEFEENAEYLHHFIDMTREKYTLGGELMDTFFTQKHCDRCGGSIKGGRIMSMYNSECICLTCKDKESKRDDYDEAVKADHEEIKKGNYNFKGIKG